MYHGIPTVSSRTHQYPDGMRLLVAAATFAVLLAFAVGGGAATTGPAAPTNLEVVSATQDTVTIAWGPSQPGEFTFLGTPRKNQVKVGWGASQDTRSAVTYTFKKDGAVAATGLTQPEFTVSVGAKTRSFRMCVQAFNASGQASPETCGTMTKQ